MLSAAELPRTGCLADWVVASAAAATPELCPFVPVALEALEAAASVAASREGSKAVEEDEAASAAALVVVVVVASEAAATLALEEAVTETALEHPTERHQDLASVDGTEAIGALVGMSLEVDAHMMTDLAATETEVDMAIVIVVIVTETVETETVNAMDAGLGATWNPLAAEKVGIETGTMTAPATTTAGNEDTRVAATKTPENYAATSTRGRLFDNLVGKLIA